MILGKGAYLRQLTAATSQMKSVAVGKELAGSTPPSVFIGSYNYPDIFAGPMIAPVHGDTGIMDRPEEWITGRCSQEEIIGYRMNLVRGKRLNNAFDLDNQFVGKLQEIVLSENSLESEASFETAPAGLSFSEEHTPFGPSAPLERFEIEAQRWDHSLEKVYYDTDLLSKDAVLDLHRQGMAFSTIQKAFSAGTMGHAGNRHFVPTRWSITACDTMIGDHLLANVRKCPAIDTVRLYEFASLNNRYAVILLPTAWQYEWTEAFLHVLGNEEYVFSDFEGFRKKTGYSPLGGCYYSCKMAVLEELAKEQRQAGVIVLREALPGYVPMGVFNVRENVRSAMKERPTEFEDLKGALGQVSERFTLPMQRFITETTLLKDCLRQRQCTLSDFAAPKTDPVRTGEAAGAV
ncbi:Nre family DNA repair protein [Methanoregula sp.]|uniref:Nre family DNA repair protein n=1 Tax=Methanoregula sp. TaxID=2052170 RepID=UPI002BEFDFE7|nr:Nre family DNA repair protein [Methanoregula sp.]HVP96188.1 Nre family DNA repair protein [Methanoregula sp.]